MAQEVSARQEHLPTRAVGGAVSRNHISLIIPCHRVVGSHGNLTGYAAGIDKKIQLLKLEDIDPRQFHLPRKSPTVKS